MKIVLSSNIDHYKYTAKALQKENILEKFICAAFFKERPWFYKFSRGYKSWIDNRIESELDFNIVDSFVSYELIYKCIRNRKIFNDNIKRKIDLNFNLYFDKYSKYKLKRIKDINYFHYVSSVGYYTALELKNRCGCKIIVDDRAEHRGFLAEIMRKEHLKFNIPFDEREIWNIDCRREYELADYIITPSTFSKDTFISQGVDKDKLVVIPYGCDTTKFYPMNKEEKDEEKFTVIYVGNICLRKGAYYLVEAFKKIKKSNIELLLIGKVEDELKDYITSVKSTNHNIIHIEYIPNNKLNEYYSKSDVFVLPSLSDSFSLATIEAMSAGLPVIISENVGAKDFVIDNKNGFIVPVRNSEAIKEKILQLFKNREEKKYMGINARESVKDLTWESYEKKIINFYNYISM